MIFSLDNSKLKHELKTSLTKQKRDLKKFKQRKFNELMLKCTVDKDKSHFIIHGFNETINQDISLFNFKIQLSFILVKFIFDHILN